VQIGRCFVKRDAGIFFSEERWDPSIAAAPNAISRSPWDTYDKGDYDVYFRRMRADLSSAPRSSGWTRRLRSRPAIILKRAVLSFFDAKNRLWVAVRDLGYALGKDFGAYQTTGIALYQGHNIQVKCFDGPTPSPPPTAWKISCRCLRKRCRRLARRRVADQVPTPGPESLKAAQS